MKTQNYTNHIRYYPPHHFIFYPVGLVLAGISIYGIFKSAHDQSLWIVLTGVIMMLLCLSFMVRQHYALGNQNRIVRLELRLRYYILTQQRFEAIEEKLSQGQMFALRFASDEELPELVTRALKENLTADEIKKSIKHWLPDYMRA